MRRQVSKDVARRHSAVKKQSLSYDNVIRTNTHAMVVTTNRKLRQELAPISNASVRCYAIRLQDGTLACIIKLTDNRLVYHTEPQTDKITKKN